MKITTEQAIDMLPAMVEIYEKTKMNELIKESRKNFKAKEGVDSEDIIIDAMSEIGKKILKQAPILKKEIYEISAIAQNITPEEARNQSFAKNIVVVRSIIKDEEVMELFNLAM